MTAEPAANDALHPVDQAVSDFAAALKAQRLKNDDLAGLLAQQETLAEQIAAGQKDLAAAAADTQAKRQALDAACDASGLTVSARAVSAAAETVGADNSQPEEKAVAVDHASDTEDTADNE